MIPQFMRTPFSSQQTYLPFHNPVKRLYFRILNAAEEKPIVFMQLLNFSADQAQSGADIENH